MRLRVGPNTLPQNEAVASITYSPVYDVTKRVAKLRERWDISGRIVLQGTNATQSQMTAEILRRQRIYQADLDLVFLEDDTDTPTVMQLLRLNCLLGPYIIDSSLPNQANDVFATGMGYRIVYEAERLGSSDGLLEFSESLTEGPGGLEYVYAGGSVNFPERQVGTQNTPWQYTQSGRAVGLFGYPAPPPPIWPFALMRKPRIERSSPRVLGRIDTEYEISWTYEFEWHQELRGVPHRRV